MLEFTKEDVAAFFDDREQTQLFLLFGAVTYLDGKTPKQIPGFRLKLEKIPGSQDYRLVHIEYSVGGDFIKRIYIMPQYVSRGDLDMVWPEFEKNHRYLYARYSYYNLLDGVPGVYPGSKPEEGEDGNSD